MDHAVCFPQGTPRDPEGLEGCGERRWERFANYDNDWSRIEVLKSRLHVYHHVVKGIRFTYPSYVWLYFPWMDAEKDNSLRSSGRGCTDVAPATRSTTSVFLTASSLESIMAKASHTPPFMLTRSELTCKLKHLLQMLWSWKDTETFTGVVSYFVTVRLCVWPALILYNQVQQQSAIILSHTSLIGFFFYTDK